jgi:hypothetical protein
LREAVYRYGSEALHFCETPFLARRSAQGANGQYNQRRE